MAHLDTHVLGRVAKRALGTSSHLPLTGPFIQIRVEGLWLPAPVTIVSGQLGKTCFLNWHHKPLTPWGREDVEGGEESEGGQGAGGQ